VYTTGKKKCTTSSLPFYPLLLYTLLMVLRQQTGWCFAHGATGFWVFSLHHVLEPWAEENYQPLTNHECYFPQGLSCSEVIKMITLNLAIKRGRPTSLTLSPFTLFLTHTIINHSSTRCHIPSRQISHTHINIIHTNIIVIQITQSIQLIVKTK